jgi:hypothetical protein
METGEHMKPLFTPITPITPITSFDSESKLLPQPLKGVVVVVTRKTTCRYCQYWTGTPTSRKALCRHHHGDLNHAITPHDWHCGLHEPSIVPDIPAQARPTVDPLQGQPAHIEIVPANYHPTIEIWGDC